LGEILAAILAIQSMILLGFADDVLDVRWRYKVWFPAIAGIPLLIFYYTNMGVTYVVMPMQLRPYVGDLVDLGKFILLDIRMIITADTCRTTLLCIYGDGDYILYTQYQHFGRHQRYRGWPVTCHWHIRHHQ
jgi:UDP-N-acetylglucosamine--dolichyl-phosphate N-acetylglucosaminephosphotransferase